MQLAVLSISPWCNLPAQPSPLLEVSARLAWCAPLAGAQKRWLYAQVCIPAELRSRISAENFFLWSARCAYSDSTEMQTHTTHVYLYRSYTYTYTYTYAYRVQAQSTG